MINSNSAMTTILNLLRMLAVSFICCCTVTLSQTIAIASTSNATHTVYDTSQSEEFRDSSFYCSTSYCTITCDTTQGCREAEVAVSNSISANIVCSGYMSCYKLAVQIVDTENVEIECSGSEFSCAYMVITIDDATSANILCPGSSSCSGMGAFIFDTETVEISCTDGGACYDTDITVNNSNSFKMCCGDSISNQQSFCSSSTIDIVANEAEINALGTRAALNMEIQAQLVQSRFVSSIYHRVFH